MAEMIYFVCAVAVGSCLGALIVGKRDLRHVPGPLLASITNIPRVLWVLSNRAHDIHISLHERYGKLVRFGPNMVSVGDATEISKIYGFGRRFVKVSAFTGCHDSGNAENTT